MKPLVLMTGSSGLIGSRIAKALMERYHVVGLDKNPPQKATDGSDFIEFDLTSDLSLADALIGKLKKSMVIKPQA